LIGEDALFARKHASGGTVMKNKRALVIEQLDETLRKIRPLRQLGVPAKGWIRAIRDALGMNGRQLADRLKVYRARTSQIEKDELTGAVTFKTMRRVAEGMDCVFVYGFVPRTSLKETVRNQARKVAIKHLGRASLTMGLEDQALSTNENESALSDMVEELVETLPSTLWDEV
jgi:predicted DNA-binding mobile mystery protein A